MRKRGLLFLLSMVAAPTVASAQYYYAPPPPVAAVPPHVYIRERVRWHLHHQAPVVVVQGAPPVWLAPAPPSPPPPPVYLAPPPPPQYVLPQPVYVQPGYYYPPPCYSCAARPAPVAVEPVGDVAVVRVAGGPEFASKFGLGVTGEGMFTVDNGTNQGYGILAQMRYRSSRHLGIELMGGYEKSNDKAQFARTDIPLTFGLLVPILGPEHALTPYLVGAAGVNFADVRLLDAPSMKIDDSRTQILAQGGAGLELRLGDHLALNADARVEGRWNTSGPSEAVKNTTSINGKPVQPIDDSVGVRVGVGATMYF